MSDPALDDDVVRLPAVLDLTAAAGLHQDLLARQGRPLDIDGSAVERLGGLCLQVLISAARTWAEDGQTLRILNPSSALSLALAGFGADRLMPLLEGETT